MMELRNRPPVAFGLRILGEAAGKAALEVRLEENESFADQCFRLDFPNGVPRLCAGSDAGFLYGLLELADGYDGGWRAEPRFGSPYLEKRGIKFNIPLDARTPSYSDASDSAFENIPEVWCWEFWTAYLDAMARARFNVLTLWSLSPFPSLVQVPEYPAAALTDVVRSTVPPRPEMSGKNMWTEDMARRAYPVKRMSINEKIAFWNRVMEYARDRCIQVYLFTWNLFTYGMEGNPYGIDSRQENPQTARYLYSAVCALLEAYPLLAGIGIASAEAMRGDETDVPFLRETYGRAIEDYCAAHPTRTVELIHRMQYARYHQIAREYENYPQPFYVSFKYAQAHLHSPRPGFFQEFLEQTQGEERFWLTLRDDDNYLYRWCDEAFASNFFREIPAERVRGVYLGADGFTWGRDYTSWGDAHPLYLEKMWCKTALFGAMAYDPYRRRDWLLPQFCRRLKLSAAEAERLLEAFTLASGVFQMINAVHWHDYDFQWYPEGCCMFLHPPVGKLVFADVLEFTECPAMPHTPYLSVREECMGVSAAEHCKPSWMSTRLCAVKLEVEELLKALPRFLRRKNPEAAATVEDIRALALLAGYYGQKLAGAVALCRFRLDRSRKEERRRAVEYLTRAAVCWKEYSAYSTMLYRPQRLTRLGGQRVDFQSFDRAAELDIELAQKC